MAETINIQRGNFEVPPGSWPGGSGGSLNVGQLSPAVALQGTIRRTISFPSVHVSVGTPGTGTPPEDWWQQIVFNWFIYASYTASPSFPTFGHDASVLFCGKLQGRLVASPSQPTAYYVTFEGPPDGFMTEGQRKAPPGDDIYVNTGMRWDDPLDGLNSGLYSATSVYVRTTDICVFGEQI